MKLNGGRRVLMFFHWLFSLLICAGLVAYVVWPDIVKSYYDKFAAQYGARQLLICGIAILVVYVILAIAQLVLIFKRRKKADRGFIVVDSSDNSRVRIAISAIEQMVRQSVTNIEGINDMKIAIENLDDAIQIGVRASIVNGCHVPTITMNMQRAIRQFVEMNCGVAVRAVSITIKSVTGSEGGRRKKHKGEVELPAAPVAPIPVPEEKPVQPVYVPEEKPVQPTVVPDYVPAYTPKEEPVAPVTESAAVEAVPESPFGVVDTAPEQTAAPVDDPIARYFAGVRAEAEDEAAESPDVNDDEDR